jgi:hypothetical protein
MGLVAGSDRCITMNGTFVSEDLICQPNLSERGCSISCARMLSYSCMLFSETTLYKDFSLVHYTRTFKCGFAVLNGLFLE